MNYSQNKGYSMNNISSGIHSTPIEQDKGQMTMEDIHSSKGEVIVKSVATAVVVSSIIHAGKGVMAALSRHPLVMFSIGMGAGYLAHKYRKKIISVTGKTAEQSKGFVLRQKENLKDLFAETEEDAGEKDASK
jgi:hypothetical protein